MENTFNPSDFKILIVDDVMSNVLLLKVLLQKESYQICTANNGNQCLEKVSSEKPDLVLLDVMMPDIDGFTVAEKLKGNPETQDVPIIFLTALSSPTELTKGFKVGGNDYLTKPFNKDELLVRVKHQVELVASKRLIQKQNEDLRETIANRDKMYSVIAHDLRSPMAGVVQTLNLLRVMLTKEIMGEELYNLLDKTYKEAETVHELQDNLLKWTKSQTGKLSVMFQNLTLDDILPGIIDFMKINAESKNIELTYVSAGEPIVVRADNDMLKTVVRNFIANAIKFSFEGNSIETVVTRQGNMAKISVVDHGIGIAADRVNSIFSKGETTHGTRDEEGSGLGLMLCQEFARRNGGDVMVESELGKGSTFSVMVPLAE